MNVKKTKSSKKIVLKITMSMTMGNHRLHLLNEEKGGTDDPDAMGEL